jgi:hypothetical protein
MVRTLRYNRTFAEAGRGDPERRDEEKRSWLEELKETLGFQSRQRRPRKKMPVRARFSLGYFIVALLLMILIQNIFLAETIHRIPYSEFKDLLRTAKSASPSAKMIRGLVKGQRGLGGTRLFLTIRVQDRLVNN